jgi:hypothetical protein
MTLPDLSAGQTGHVGLHKAIRNRLLDARDFPSLQAAIDAAGNHGRVIVPPGVHTVPGLNLTDRRGVVVEGVSQTGSVINLDGYPVDMAGAMQCALRNLTIHGHVANPPQVGLLLGRGFSPGGRCTIDNVSFSGRYQLGCILGVSNEVGTFRNLSLWPDPTESIQFGIYTAGVNTWDISSRYTTLAIVPGNTCNWYSNLSIVCMTAEAAKGAFVPLWLGDSNGVVVRDSYLATNGQAYIRLDLDHYHLQFEGIVGEGAPANAILATEGATNVLIVRNFAAPNNDAIVNQTPGAVINGLIVEGCRTRGGIV